MKLAKAVTKELSLSRSNQILNAGLKAVAEFISGSLSNVELAATFDALKDAEKVVEDLQTNLKARLVEQVKQLGKQSTERGSLRLEADGWEIEARVSRTGYDPRKVEALLRAKNLDVPSYMTTKITFAVDEARLQAAALTNKLTQDELDTCRYESGYTLQRPKRVG